MSFGRDQVIFLRPGRRVNVARACLGDTRPLLLSFSKENAMGSHKPVSVRAYTRRRHGRVEHVRRHFRSYPRR